MTSTISPSEPTLSKTQFRKLLRDRALAMTHGNRFRAAEEIKSWAKRDVGRISFLTAEYLNAAVRRLIFEMEDDQAEIGKVWEWFSIADLCFYCLRSSPLYLFQGKRGHWYHTHAAKPGPSYRMPTAHAFGIRDIDDAQDLIVEVGQCHR